MIKRISKAIFVIIGTLIGAGFASGQEIYLFFYQYGTNRAISKQIWYLNPNIIYDYYV